MRLPSGQPLAEWQNGTPQSMQRLACRASASCSSLPSISPKSRNRSDTGRRSGVRRPISMNAVGLPMAYLLGVGAQRAVERLFVVVRQDANELARDGGEV